MRDSQTSQPDPSEGEADKQLAELNKTYANFPEVGLYNSNITPRNKAIRSFAGPLLSGEVALAWAHAGWYIHLIFVAALVFFAWLTSRDHRNGKYKHEEAKPRHPDAGP